MNIMALPANVLELVPSNGATVSSPFAFSYKSTDGVSGQVWIDFKLAHGWTGAAATFSFTLAPGPHRFVVQSFDKAGVRTEVVENITVSTAPSPAITTTLTAERANNTSVGDSFKGTSAGCVKASNISKAPIQEMLPNSDCVVIAHLMDWWKSDGYHVSSDGINVGYNSSDPLEVKKQLTDMKSRGVKATAMDWYGPSRDTVLGLWKTAAEADGSFKVAAQPDSGIYKTATSATQSQQMMVTALQYLSKNYFASPSYLRIGGRPLIMFFINSDPGLDWKALRACIAADNPLMIHRNASGFKFADTDGSFSWDQDLDTFYTAGKASGKLIIGSALPGFNDTLAPWGKNRIISRNHGQLWLDCFAKARYHFSETDKLPAILLVTWNDYEEGTEMESGVDAGLAVTASASGTKLSYSATGNLNALRNFEVFSSTDGANLTRVATSVAASQLDVSTLKLPAGAYKFFVKAVGKNSIVNAMSGPILVTLT